MVQLILPLVAACKSPKVAHAGDNPRFPLSGAHALIPCEACHGPGTPEAQPTECIACHDGDRPTPDHYAGQDCVGCHTDVAWNQLIGSGLPTGDTGDADTDADSDSDTDTDTEPAGHPIPTDETTLCADCHEANRKAPDHYPASDCKVCHTPVAPGTTGWLPPFTVHPLIVPHGDGTVHNCSDCHPDGDTTEPVTCSSSCHAGIFPHYGAAGAPGPAADAACAGCHPVISN